MISVLVFECIILTLIPLLEDDHSFEDASNSMEMISSDVLSVVTLKSINQILNFLLITERSISKRDWNVKAGLIHDYAGLELDANMKLICRLLFPNPQSKHSNLGYETGFTGFGLHAVWGHSWLIPNRWPAVKKMRRCV